MIDDQTTHLQFLLERLQQGDESVRNSLICCAYERLRLLARNTLHQEFPRFENLHDSGSILHEAAIGLLKALEKERPATVRGFLALATKKIREVLLDLARRDRRRGGEVRGHGGSQESSQSTPPHEAADTSGEPGRMAQWTEFHEKVNALPDEQREVVELYWYQGLSQVETARLLGISQSEVSRLWIKATQNLPDCAP